MLFLDGLPTSWEQLGGSGHGKTSPSEELIVGDAQMLRCSDISTEPPERVFTKHQESQVYKVAMQKYIPVGVTTPHEAIVQIHCWCSVLSFKANDLRGKYRNLLGEGLNYRYHRL